MKLAKLYDRFLASKPHSLGVALDADLPTLGIDLFAALPWNETDWWRDANMESVFRYLRASKDLRLGEYRHLFPTEV